MRLNVEKNLIAGKYRLKVEVAELSTEEKQQIEKFGAPWVSIAPKTVWFASKYRDELHLDQINHEFEFTNESDANLFIEALTQSIKRAITELRAKKDQFTGSKEYDF